jgi:hypothetical protein
VYLPEKHRSKLGRAATNRKKTRLSIYELSPLRNEETVQVLRFIFSFLKKNKNRSQTILHNDKYDWKRDN